MALQYDITDAVERLIEDTDLSGLAVARLQALKLNFSGNSPSAFESPEALRNALTLRLLYYPPVAR